MTASNSSTIHNSSLLRKMLGGEKEALHEAGNNCVRKATSSTMQVEQWICDGLSRIGLSELLAVYSHGVYLKPEG